MNPGTEAYYQTRYSPHPGRDRVWGHITRYLLPYWGLKPDSSVLELGAGYGSWIRSVPLVHRYALDLNPNIVGLFKELKILGVDARTGSCVNLAGWRDGSLDLVLASNLLEHLSIEDATRTIQEVHRVLKPGGRFCVIQPNFAISYREYFDDFTHRTVFTDRSLSDLLTSCAFRVERVWRRFVPFSMKSKGAGLSFLVPFYLRSPWKPRAGQMCLIAAKPQ